MRTGSCWARRGGRGGRPSAGDQAAARLIRPLSGPSEAGPLLRGLHSATPGPEKGSAAIYLDGSAEEGEAGGSEMASDPFLGPSIVD